MSAREAAADNSKGASADWLNIGIAATPDGSEVSSDHSEGVPYSDAMTSDAMTLAAGFSAHSSLAGITTGDEASAYSVGSKAHSAGRCKPCAFFHKQGCQNGSDCLFCHRCPPHEKQRRKRVRRKMIRDRMMRQAADYSTNAAHGSTSDWNGAQAWMRDMPPAPSGVPAAMQLPDVGHPGAVRVHWGMPVVGYTPSAVQPLDESGAASPSRSTACQVWENPSPTNGHGHLDQRVVHGGGWTIAAPYQHSVMPPPFPVPDFTTTGRYADSPTASEQGGMGYQTIQYALVPVPMPAVQQHQVHQDRFQRGYVDGGSSPMSCTTQVGDHRGSYRGDWQWGGNDYYAAPPATMCVVSPHGDDFCQNAPIEVPAC
mmetsp:Transcript_79631/g.140932  ORF Transcript_79631/g.140932 Transcript_79631/m.140932 type:complete len:370 (+) Transcript_79631:110-1219(+)